MGLKGELGDGGRGGGRKEDWLVGCWFLVGWKINIVERFKEERMKKKERKEKKKRDEWGTGG